MKNLLSQASRLFKRFSLREQILFSLFTIVMIAIWLSSFATRAGAWNDERRRVGSQLEDQQLWLDRSEAISAGLRTALERVDPSKTFSGTQLSGRIDDIARSVSLPADIDPVRTTEGEIFNEHSLRVRLRRVSIDRLVAFQERLSAETPYIILELINIEANRSSPEQLNATYTITSFELEPGAITQ